MPDAPLAAQVVIDVSTRVFESAFSYAVPDELSGQVQVGCAVVVDFSNRPAVGYVTGLAPLESLDVDPAKVKPVRAVLGGPFFLEQAPALAAWIAHEYVAPLSDAMHLFCPPGPAPRAKRTVDEAGNVTWSIANRGTSRAVERWAVPAPQLKGYTPPATATRQQALVSLLGNGPVRVADLSAALGADANAAVRALEKKGLLAVEERKLVRGSAKLPPLTADDVELTAGQAKALDAVEAAVEARRGDVVVLDGVTGSGKTEVYLRAVRRVLEQGGGAIILVPEISLTPQTVNRFKSRFGDTVAVLHSRLSTGERYDQWDLLRTGAARVAVGARSALFAPVRDLRLIVIDEEHESTYKQDSSPRYHARDVASHMARELGAALVLGSATPSIEALSRCAAPRPADGPTWTRVELPERVTGRPLPPVSVVDLTHEFEVGNRSMFSPVLTQALCEAMARDEKAVVLYNRRGFARFLLCRECGYVPRCEECSISLTYHESFGSLHEPKLVCHHCGRFYPVPARCPNCGSPYLRRVGKGTQQVELELAQLFSAQVDREVPIVRMDADTVKAKGAHEALLAQFSAAPRGVLLGTQMIAKGLDFPEVTVAAVINADTSLALPDFRSGERTYQLIEQVAGRAGRGEAPGQVIVQTYWPDHPAIRAAAAHDRTVFLDAELPERSGLGYPPFSRLANVRVWGREVNPVRASALDLADKIRSAAPDDGSWQVLGPSPCLIERTRNSWQWHVLVKAPVGADLPGVIGSVLRARKSQPGVSVAADIDPASLF